ncbi:SIMPL domain-containing protein [Shinella sp.]|uniref:SIMPL domain-containing protein n=1 Tax=Shinella sp. TaxID=1870904 RepID=UPI003F6E4CC5
MRNIILPALLLAGVVGAPLAAGAQEPVQPRIHVAGEGEAAVAPDMAILTLTVMRDGDTARIALDGANEAMNAVVSAMREAGIEGRDLQTSGLQISPRYVYPQDGQGQPRITGYEVINTLTVRVREIAEVGELLDLSVTLGVNQGGQITFTNADPKAVLEEARRAAVTDARTRAETLADAAGVTLGSVVEISEVSRRPTPMPIAGAAMRMEAAADAAVPVEAGENVYRVEVTVTFSIGE